MGNVKRSSRLTGVDPSTNTLQVIDYPHHEIHGGSHYHLAQAATLDSGEKLRFIITTPNDPKWSHFLGIVKGTLTTDIKLYEGTTHVASSASVVGYNNNRNSSNTAGLKFFYVASTSGSDGTLIDRDRFGTGTSGGKQPGEGSREFEWILKQNEDYFFEILSGANNNRIAAIINWYEHTDKA